MRIQWNSEENDFHDVQEIYDIHAEPYWSPGHGAEEKTAEKSYEECPPTGISIVIEKGDEEDWTDIYAGEYIFSENFTWKEAMKNFNAVTEKLLTQGYCRASDFENVDWH